MRRFSAVVLVGVAGVAIAAPKGSSKDAKEAFEKASSDYKLQKYEEALVGFESVYRLTNEPSVLFNIGQCYKQLGRYDEALKAFRAFIRDDPKSPQRSAAEARIQEIEQELSRLAQKGVLKLSTKQDPAEVWVDEILKGSSPVTVSELEAGEHELQVKKSGFVSYAAKFTIKPAETTSLESIALVPVEIKEFGMAKRLGWVALGSGGAGLLTASASMMVALSVSAQQKQPTANEDATRQKLENRITLAKVSGVGGVSLLVTSAATAAAYVVFHNKAIELRERQESKP